MYSGFGGQVDFIRGAAEAVDGQGKPIIALVSTTKRGESKIVPTLKVGEWIPFLAEIDKAARMSLTTTS